MSNIGPFLILVLAVVLTECGRIPNKVLLVSFDGMRWDYPRIYNTPNFNFLIQRGVSAPDGMVPPFVTKTFPCHYTLATGLWEESHGIIDNTMYDPLTNETFRKTNIASRWWDQATPIWISAKLQGLRSGVYFWPGSETKLRGIYADFYVRYNSRTPYETRVNTMVQWLTTMDVDLGVMYFHEPDHTSHEHGAGSHEVRKAVEEVDRILGYLIDLLQRTGLFDQINLVIVSDHGMTNRIEGRDHLIVLHDYINVDRDALRIPHSGPLAGIFPRDGKLQMVYDKLKNAHRNMTVYKKEDMPERFHYKNNRRSPPIVAIADEGFVIAVKNRSTSILGQHGYDNKIKSMHTVFIAQGPAFKKNVTVPSFDMVHVYPLLCHLLNIIPEANNGSLDILKPALSENITY